MTNFAMQYKLLFGKFNSLAADNKWRVLESYLLRISVQQANWARRTPLQFHPTNIPHGSHRTYLHLAVCCNSRLH